MTTSIYTITDNATATKALVELQSKTELDNICQNIYAGLYEYSKKVYDASPASKKISRKEDREDIFQEVMTTVFINRKKFDPSRVTEHGGTSYGTWLNTIINSKTNDYLRKSVHRDKNGNCTEREFIDIDAFAESITSQSLFLKTDKMTKEQQLVNNYGSEYESPEEHIMTETDKEIVSASIEELRLINPKYAMALELRYFENKSIKEIAEVMGISEKAAERTLAHARERMKTILLNEHEYESER